MFPTARSVPVAADLISGIRQRKHIGVMPSTVGRQGLGDPREQKRKVFPTRPSNTLFWWQIYTSLLCVIFIWLCSSKHLLSTLHVDIQSPANAHSPTQGNVCFICIVNLTLCLCVCVCVALNVWFSHSQLGLQWQSIFLWAQGTAAWHSTTTHLLKLFDP